MTDSMDYRQYLESEFGHIRSELTEIKTQVTQTNGTVRQHEKYIQYADDIIETRGEETKEIVNRLDKIDVDLLEVRFFKKYPKVGFGLIAVLVIGIIISAYGTFKATTNTILMRKMETNMEIQSTRINTADSIKTLKDNENKIVTF